ncbi:MAG: iron-containing alcohol dehydrogenase [Pseudomonadota bacterium]
MQAFDVGRVPPMTVGAGRLSETGAIASALGVGPVLVVADAILADLGVTGRLTASLQASGLGVEMAAEIAGEPKDAHVDRLAARARETGAGVVIGIGGGAAMDAAKLVAAVAVADQPARHYALGANPFPARTLPAIAIPTTAGTGSEVTRTSIVSTAEGFKYWYWGEELMFAHALLDPELTVSLPAHITAWTGIDAVAHALEAVTSRKVNAVGRLYGLAALELLAVALPKAVADGADIEARGKVLWGAATAGLALHNCNTHMGHNISHALGSLAPIHHGLATGLALEVTLPELTARPEGREDYAVAAAALGGPGYARSLPEAFAALMRQIGIAPDLPEACAHVTPDALAASMKAPANLGMAQNAACDLSGADLDEFAAAMIARLPELRATA